MLVCELSNRLEFIPETAKAWHLTPNRRELNEPLKFFLALVSCNSLCCTAAVSYCQYLTLLSFPLLDERNWPSFLTEDERHNQCFCQVFHGDGHPRFHSGSPITCQPGTRCMPDPSRMDTSFFLSRPRKFAFIKGQNSCLAWKEMEC